MCVSFLVLCIIFTYTLSTFLLSLMVWINCPIGRGWKSPPQWVVLNQWIIYRLLHPVICQIFFTVNLYFIHCPMIWFITRLFHMVEVCAYYLCNYAYTYIVMCRLWGIAFILVIALFIFHIAWLFLSIIYKIFYKNCFLSFVPVSTIYPAV